MTKTPEPPDPNDATRPGRDTPGRRRGQFRSPERRRAIDVYTVEGLGAVIAQLRQAAGLSQSHFGAAVGASRPWISDLERGNLRGGQLETALACIHALGYRIVLEDVDTKPSRLDELKDAMRDGPLARRPSPSVAEPGPSP